MKNFEYHNKQVKRLNIDPSKLVIDRNGSHELSDVVMSGEMNFFDENSLIAQPDGVLFGKYGDVYVFEYKIRGNRRRARVQLLTAFEHLRKHMGVRARLFYVSGRFPGYKTEEVLP